MPLGDKLRTFIMIRNIDESGVSGTGKILEGVVFTNNFTVVHWLGKFECINVHKNFSDFVHIHITSHPGNDTEIIWNDGTIEKFKPE